MINSRRSDWAKKQSDFDSHFKLMNRIVVGFIALVFVLIITIWCFYGYVAYKGVTVMQSTDMSQGIKPVIEQLWCGAPDCMK